MQPLLKPTARTKKVLKKPSTEYFGKRKSFHFRFNVPFLSLLFTDMMLHQWQQINFFNLFHYQSNVLHSPDSVFLMD